MTDKIYRYTGFFYEVAGDDSGWVAELGGGHWTKDQLRKALAAEQNAEQRTEIEKAIADLPDDNVQPKRGQRRRMIPADD